MTFFTEEPKDLGVAPEWFEVESAKPYPIVDEDGFFPNPSEASIWCCFLDDGDGPFFEILPSIPPDHMLDTYFNCEDVWSCFEGRSPEQFMLEKGLTFGQRFKVNLKVSSQYVDYGEWDMDMEWDIVYVEKATSTKRDQWIPFLLNFYGEKILLDFE